MSSPPVSARAQRRSGALVVSAVGEIDIATAPDVSRVVAEELRSEPASHLVIDLLDVSFMDSSGLGCLVAIRQGHPDLPITLVIGAGMVEDLLRMTAVDSMFEIAGSVPEATRDGGESV